MGTNSSENETELRSLKAKLIDFKTESHDLNDFTNAHDRVAHLIRESPKASHSLNVLAADTLSIWYLRATQAFKARNEKLFSDLRAPIDDDFEWLTKSLEFSHSAQMNAGLGLLKRMIQYGIEANRTVIEELCMHWFHGFLSQAEITKSSYQILECIAKECPSVSKVQNLQETLSHIISSLNASAIANAASKCFAALAQNLLADSGSEGAFVGLWAPVVVKGLHDPTLNSNIVQYLLPLLLRSSKNSIGIFIKNYSKDSRPDLLLSVLNVSQTLSKSQDPIELGILSEEKAFGFLVSDDEKIRLAAFQLIVSTIKTNRVPPDHIQRLLIDQNTLDGFVEDSRSPETRDAFSSTLRKAVIALRSSHIHNLASAPQQTKETLQTLQRYFMSWLSPASSYSSLLIAFDFFEVLVEEEFDGVPRKRTKKAKVNTHVLDVYNDTFISILLRFTTNNYEDIRAKARKLLLQCGEIKELDESNTRYQDFLSRAFQGLSSTQGRKSDECVNLLMLVLSRYAPYPNKFKSFVLSALVSLESCEASSHGYYTLFASIMTTYPSFVSSQLELWKEIFLKLVACCDSEWLKYKSNTTFDTLEDSEGMEAISWRPVRESTLMLQTMIKVNSASQITLIDDETHLAICELLRDQLSNITHRGVFSAIFNTYVDACRLCLERNGLKNYPTKWLRDDLSIVQQKTQFVSRRSGGLPFLITGVLNALLKEGNFTNSLSTTLTELAAFTRTPLNRDARSTVGFPQVHAFNCIKQLFLDSNLYPHSKLHLSATLALALDFLDSKEWSIKNAALMLFTALHSRIFGTNMVAKSMTKMKSSVFFNMYGGIEDRFVSRLEEDREGKGSFVEGLLAILTMLERLEWTSPGRFQMILSERFLGHKVWKVRKVTARILVSMETSSPKETISRSLLPRLLQSQSHNEIHGILSMLCELQAKNAFGIHESENSQKLTEKDVLAVCPAILSLERWELKSLFFDFVMGCEDNIARTEIAAPLSKFLAQELSQKGPSSNGPRGSALAKLVQTLYNIFQDTDEEDLAKDLLSSALDCDIYEVQVAVLACCEKAPTLGQVLKEKLTRIVSLESIWWSIRIKCLQVLTAHGIRYEGSLTGLEWSEVAKVSQSAFKKDTTVTEIQKHLRIDAPDEIREAVTKIISRKVLEPSVGERDYRDEYCVLLLLLSRESSRDIRRIAADALCKAYNLPVEWSTSYVFKKALEGRGLRSIDSEHILYRHLASFKEDLQRFSQKTQTDLDRDDLYKNDVKVYREFAKYVPQGTVTYKIDEVLKLISEKDTLKAWEYDYDFDTGVSKLLAIASDEDKTRILEALKGIGYVSANINA